MKRRSVLIMIFLFGQFLTGCQRFSNNKSDITVLKVDVATQPVNSSTMEPYVFKTSEPGKITLHGVLFVKDPMSVAPAPDDSIFFVPLADGGIGLSTIPAFEVGQVPQAEVDERTGEFVFTNIDPGTYAVVVITINGLQVPARIYSSGNLAIITVKEAERGKVIEIGDLKL